MTLEEAIKHAEEVAEEHTKYNRYGGFESCDECAEEHRQLAEWLKDYKRLLEQQPCGDAISRQAYIERYRKWSYSEYGRKIDNGALAIRVAMSLPPVISKTRCSCEQIKWERDMAIAQLKELGYGLGEKPKTGHWILLDECSNSGYYCSECHKKVVKEGWSNTVKKIKFCPNCGCRMVEPQESEK